MPTARQNLGVVAADGRIYAIGGTNETASTAYSTVEAYDPTSNTWSTVAPLPIAVYAMGGAATADGKIYVAGGIVGAGGVGWTAALQIYDTATNKWTLGASLPGGISSQALVAASNGLIYNIDGWLGGPISSVYAYDPKTNTWSSRASDPVTRSNIAAVQSSDGLIYVVGGLQGVNYPNLATVEAYDPATDTWTTRASMLTPSSHLAAVAAGGRVWALGGNNDNASTCLDAVEAYDPLTNRWVAETSLPVAMCNDGAAQPSGEPMYVMGASATSFQASNYEGTLGPGGD
jgi:N-acetylneuraminic acid mutarotase